MLYFEFETVLKFKTSGPGVVLIMLRDKLEVTSKYLLFFFLKKSGHRRVSLIVHTLLFYHCNKLAHLSSLS